MPSEDYISDGKDPSLLFNDGPVLPPDTKIAVCYINGRGPGSWLESQTITLIMQDVMNVGLSSVSFPQAIRYLREYGFYRGQTWISPTAILAIAPVKS
jgi:hypothetical protein